ncbi:YceI family protein [Hymenobacter chitinivorans]|uniref:YceI-like domain-containing protein n=1 Tax=Hymenobacter chitinivorans DSM 11115 TaxID=1121954 RepID=A0A2M9BA42_9BACT|nr:YceI family protein [Hymenobacter chitinivorans]PJJ54816.1 YceI-like domain-containing protein [Hymenobacter chitinivorans DSM 11115]
MKHWLLLGLGLLLLLPPARAQGKYSTRAGLIRFFSGTPIEDIEGRSTQAAGMLDLTTGKVAFSVPMKSFVFKRTLMQEHFNENYVESDKYPKATFAGAVVDFQPGQLPGAGPQRVQVEGDLTIHGVKRRVKVPGTLELKDNHLLVTSKFNVAPADYNIEIPALVRDNIAKSMEVTLAFSCDLTPTSQTAVAR